jgi:hypothetical protein
MVLHEGWREAQAASRYPFADSASLTTTDGLVLPRQAVLDASVHPPAAGPFRLLAVRVSASAVAIDVAGVGRDALATATFTAAVPDEVLPLLTPAGRPAGLLVLDPTAASTLRAWPRGTHEFRSGTADFVPSVCAPAAPGGVAGIVVGDEVFSGEVTLVGENGVVLSVEADDGSGRRVIRFDVVGDPLFFRSDCEGAKHEAGGPGLEAKSYLKKLRVAGDTSAPDDDPPESAVDLIPVASQIGVVLAPLVDPAAETVTALRITASDGRIRIGFAGAKENA